MSFPATGRVRDLLRRTRIVLLAALVAVPVGLAVPGNVLAAEIAFRGATSSSNAVATTLQLSTPPGTASGDVLLAGVSVRGKPKIVAPGGWALVLSTGLGNTMTQAVYVRVAGASEPSAATWTFSKAAAGAGGIVGYSGVDTALPVDVSRGQSNAASTTITAPSVTTTAPNDLLVAFFGSARTTSITPAGSLTERYEAASAPELSFRVTSAAADEHMSAAGATGPRTAVVAGSAGSIGQLVALRAATPAPSDTTPPAVTSTSPADLGTDVAVGANVLATFSESVTGVGSGTFTLAGPGSTAVPASVSYASATRTATLDPSAELAADTTYTATLSSGIEDLAGNALAATSWTFQTAASGSPPPPPPPSSGIAFRAASSAVNNATTTLVLPRPTGIVQGDVLLALVSSRGAPVISAPAGWSSVLTTQNGTLMEQAAFVRTAGASEPASYTFTLSKAVSTTGGILAYSGVDAAHPIDAAAGAVSASSATVTAPSITTSTPNAMLVAHFGMARITGFSTPAAMTERFDVSVSTALTYKISSAADDETFGGPGATGSRSATAAGATGNIGQLIALRAAGSPVVARFDGVPLSGVAPLQVSFRDQSLGSPTLFEWDFDSDGSVDSTAQHPTHTFTTPGTYSVSLRVTRGDDVDTETRTDVVIVDAEPASSPTDPVLVGAGDIADCNATGDEATAALVEGIQGTVFTLGDNVYENGTAEEWANCYGPTWGQYKALTRPSLGDHDHSDGQPATEYFNYFGVNAGDPSKGYYSYDVPGWHIVVLNTECSLAGGCGPGSPQETWLRQDLATNSSSCTLAYWHDPLYSSSKAGQIKSIPFWDALLADRADVILNGDSHVYERFAPQDAAGRSSATGIRQFIVGTGGRRLSSFSTAHPNSEVRNSATFGVLKLSLHAAGYSWQFVPVAGSTFTDSGTAACH